MNQKKYVNKEWIRLEQKEKRYIEKNKIMNVAAWQLFAEKYVPQKLDNTLNIAFYKAFVLIFDKGTAIIEKTYNREKKEQDYMIDSYAADLKKNAKTLRTFGKKVAGTKSVNMAFSTIEGIGMGILGMGIPDIPVFIGLLLKSIYEIALTYGFSYDTEKEQIFILRLIEVALLHDYKLVDGDQQINLFIEGQWIEISKEEQIKRTADALSKELLYLKFIQGFPVVGILGGVSDMYYQKKIMDYASLKYKRRFLLERKEMGDSIND